MKFLDLTGLGVFKTQLITTIFKQTKSQSKIGTGLDVDSDGVLNCTGKGVTADAVAWANVTGKPELYTKAEVNTQLATKANSSHTHANADIISLDASKLTGTISVDRLPQGALERLHIVATEAARLKLTTADVQNGDTVKVEATGLMYYVKDDTKLASEDGYAPYSAGTAASVPWSGVTGKPSTYTPSTHTHTKSQITDFPTSLPASDVYEWAKAASKPSYTYSEVGAAAASHTHLAVQITDLSAIESASIVALFL